jgi:phage/plasmid-like protein (TIGR03299 family)
MHGLFENDFMVSAMERPWHGIGAVVDGAMTSDDALRLARLDWRVIPTPIYTEGAMTAARLLPGQVPASIHGFVANVREDTNEVLGVVSDKYQIAQNEDAFRFADDLLGLGEAEGARYETAGSLFNGRKVFMLINLPEARILDDTVERYLALVNDHTGAASLRVWTTSIRIVCHNTLCLALRDAQRGVSIRHMSAMDLRKREALRVFQGADSYFFALASFAERLSGTRVNVEDLLKKLFPENDQMSWRQKESQKGVRDTVRQLLNFKEDLGNHRHDGWGFVQAVSDYQTPRVPKRRTSTWEANRLMAFIEGDGVVQRAADLVVSL